MGVVTIPAIRPTNTSSWRHGGGMESGNLGDYWKSPASICPGMLSISLGVLTGGAFGNIGVGGGWWSGYIGINSSAAPCGGGADAYVTVMAGNQIAVNVWAALAVGLWAGMVLIEVHARVAGATTRTGSLSAGPASSTFPASQSKTATVTAAAFPACGSPGLIGTIIVYDDGTFTLA